MFDSETSEINIVRNKIADVQLLVLHQVMFVFYNVIVEFVNCRKLILMNVWRLRKSSERWRKTVDNETYISSTWVHSWFLVGVRGTLFLVLCVCFVDRCLSFCEFSFGHCVVCSSSIYGFWLLLWYPKTLLSTLQRRWQNNSFRKITLLDKQGGIIHLETIPY